MGAVKVRLRMECSSAPTTRRSWSRAPHAARSSLGPPTRRAPSPPAAKAVRAFSVRRRLEAYAVSLEDQTPPSSVRRASAAEPMILPRVSAARKSVLANLLSLVFLCSYALFGAYMFMYFESEDANRFVHDDLQRRYACVDAIFLSRPYDASVAIRIAQECVAHPDLSKTQVWDLKNALLYGFGILTTLGYGKIETRTSEGRVFTVVWGVLGVPVTVIILTNFGLFLRRLERGLRRWAVGRWRARCGRKPAKRRSRAANASADAAADAAQAADADAEEDEDISAINPVSLLAVVVLYLVFGAVVMPLLNERLEFVSGLYYSYICFTAIEYGALVPENGTLIPIVIFYMVVGLAISTVAVELGAVYVKKLYYVGRKAGQFSNVKIWFGAKQLNVNELLSALSQTIGIDPGTFSELDLEQLVKDAILVKEGKLPRIPQAYIFLEGIWPPSLVPLFIRDGDFPEFVDAEVGPERRHSKKSRRSLSSHSFARRHRLAYDDLPQTDAAADNNNLVLDI